MIESFKVSWSKGTGTYDLDLYYYKERNTLWFDLENNIGGYHCACSDLTVEAAKQIRDRLNDFIKEVEGEEISPNTGSDIIRL